MVTVILFLPIKTIKLPIFAFNLWFSDVYLISIKLFLKFIGTLTFHKKNGLAEMFYWPASKPAYFCEKSTLKYQFTIKIIHYQHDRYPEKQ